MFRVPQHGRKTTAAPSPATRCRRPHVCKHRTKEPLKPQPRRPTRLAPVQAGSTPSMLLPGPESRWRARSAGEWEEVGRAVHSGTCQDGLCPEGAVIGPRIVSGSAHQALAGAVAAALDVQPVACELERFPDGELRPAVGQVRGADVYVIQPTGPRVNDHLVELLLLLDACHRGGAYRSLPWFPTSATPGRTAVPGQASQQAPAWWSTRWQPMRTSWSRSTAQGCAGGDVRHPGGDADGSAGHRRCPGRGDP
jgi:hypothetical protein